MARPVPLVVERPRRLPAPVATELRRRRAALFDRAGGRVLDLDDPTARRLVARASTGVPLGTEYDAVVAVGQLARFPDLGATLRGIDALLGPGGRLLLAEPTGRPGLLATVVGSVVARSRPASGFHLGRDVPAALRTTTLVIDDLERFAMPVAHPLLRHAVEVHAVRLPVRATTPDRSAALAGGVR